MSLGQTEPSGIDLGNIAAGLHFPVKVYSRLTQEYKTSSFVFSPCGLGASLCMLLAGAGGETASQVLQLLQLRTKEPSATSFHDFLVRLRNAVPSVRLRVANMTYIDSSFHVKHNYLAFIQKFYDASLRGLDFANFPRTAVDELNQRVERAVNAPSIVNPASVTSQTQMVLVSDLQFHGVWDFHFVHEDITKRAFTDVFGNTSQVDMMYADGLHRTCSYPELGVSAIELPYKDVNTALVLIRPQELQGMSQLEANLTPDHLDNLLRRLSTGKDPVCLTLPRFHLELTIELSKTLSDLGARNLFRPGAQLGGIADNKPLHLSQLVHRVTLKVDERGDSKASANTHNLDVIVPTATSGDHFALDRPFLFLLVSWEPFAVLFMGAIKEAPDEIPNACTPNKAKSRNASLK
ncbi:leukocyte elastase inhibitor A-like isoform X2 [Ornithodoros turicata]|uniref:leukocyte elastase inhibitor A-like isoform X2 n=1 Tax=Ornithodoros turicata TaxID=34597 RepID=UPI003138FD45